MPEQIEPEMLDFQKENCDGCKFADSKQLFKGPCCTYPGKIGENSDGTCSARKASGPKYPNVTVKLSDRDGNAFAILGRVRRELRNAKVPLEAIEEFTKEATSGDYDNVIQTSMKWVNVE
jgi:hypothetical protein